MNNSIFPCLWFDNNGAEAIALYKTVFKNVQLVQQAGVVNIFSIEGQQFMALDGGPIFTKNPAISFMALCQTEEEVESYYHKLAEGGKVMMPLDAYPWSKKFGYIEDKFGVSWQLYFGEIGGAKEKFVPTLMFVGDNAGRAEEAINLYCSLFPLSNIQGIARYPEGPDKGKVMHAQFDIDGYTLMCMDSSADHKFNFNEGVSIVVNCKSQQEIDHYWNGLINDGGVESRCGWLKDKFGVSWQIVPAEIGKWMSNPATAEKVMGEFLKMQKIDISKLMEAASQ